MSLDWIVSCELWALCGRWLGDYRQSDFLGTDRYKRTTKILLQNLCFDPLGVVYFTLTCNLIQNSCSCPPPTLLAEGWQRTFMQNQWELSDKTRPKPDLVCLISSSTSFSVARRARVTTGGSALTALFNVANNDNNRIVMLVLIITSSAYTLNNKTKLGFFLIPINIYFIWAAQSVETFMKICWQLFSIFENPYLRKRPSNSI